MDIRGIVNSELSFLALRLPSEIDYDAFLTSIIEASFRVLRTPLSKTLEPPDLYDESNYNYDESELVANHAVYLGLEKFNTMTASGTVSGNLKRTKAAVVEDEYFESKIDIANLTKEYAKKVCRKAKEMKLVWIFCSDIQKSTPDIPIFIKP